MTVHWLKVTYTADGVHLDLVNLVRQDGGLIIAHGTVAFDRCSDTVTAHPIMFVGGTGASLQLPDTWSFTTTGSSVQLTVTTNEPDGLLLYVMLGDEQAGFLAVELFEGARQTVCLSVTVVTIIRLQYLGAIQKLCHAFLTTFGPPPPMSHPVTHQTTPIKNYVTLTYTPLPRCYRLYT